MLILLVLISLYGCSISIDNVSQPFYQMHDILLISETIREGKTTEEYLLKRLGIPTIDTTDKLGNKIWIYLSMPSVGNEIRMDVTLKDGIITNYKLEGEDRP
ncbi:MAG: hypothetical protein HZC45_00445 [Deltaproteobacteria bacterium]|nr:hypothetical protein [Deltaproteobacteria bacterium]